MKPVTGFDKVALVLKGLPPLVAAQILERLDVPYREPVRVQMASLPETTSATEGVKDLLDELDTRLEQARLASVLDAPQSPTVPTQPRLAALPPADEAATDPDAPPADNPLEALRAVPATQLAPALAEEHGATVAMILNVMEAEHAGEVLKQLPADMRRDVTIRLCRIESRDPELLDRVVRAILAKVELFDDQSTNSPDAKPRQLAAILRAVERNERSEILAAMQEKNPEMADRVCALLYQFEDLQRIEDRSLQKLLGEVDAKTLATALKGATEEICVKIRNNLSRRAQENLTEEMEFLGIISIVQVREAQKLIVELIQRLDQAGELVMLD